MPVHGGYASILVNRRPVSLGVAAQLLRQIIGLMERVFFVYQRNTGTSCVGFSVLLIGQCRKMLKEHSCTLQSDLSGRDKADVITGQDDRSDR